MTRIRTASIVVMSLAFMCAAYGLPSLRAQQGAPPPAAGQQAGPGGPGQGRGGGQQPCKPGETVGQHYRNIKVIGDLPCTELQLAMQSIAASLGVGCDHCHVTGPGGGFDRDDKEPKDTARTMMKMVDAINTQQFEGRSVVGCATCHHGSMTPVPTTPLAIEMTTAQAAAAARMRAAQQGRGRGQGSPEAANAAPGGAGRGPVPPAAPAEPPKPSETVDQVLDKYVQAIGGRSALQKIQSRVMTGMVTLRDLQQVPVTVEEKLPGSYRWEVQSQPQAQVSASNGTAVWSSGRGGGGRGVQGFQAQQATRRADLPALLNMKARYENLTVNRYDSLDDRNTIVLVGRISPDTTEELHFNRESGLLLRRSVSTRTAFSPLAEQIDYDDYRTVEGVNMPFTVRYASWNDLQTAKFSEIKLNVPIDDTRFALPPQPQGRGAF